MAGDARRFGELFMRLRGVVAAILLAATVLFAGLYRIANGSEKHSFNSGAIPPTTFALTLGHNYEISVPGGRKSLDRRGVSTAAGRCFWSLGSGNQQALTIKLISADVRPTHAVASFDAPASGRIHIDCSDWGAVYVDDADNTGWDYAGLFLLLTTICLTLGVILAISALYEHSVSRRTPGDDDEVETRVDSLSGHGEVGSADSGDIAG